LVDGYTNILQHFATATEDLSGEKYPTRSMKIPIIYCLINNLTSFINTPSNRGFGVTLARHLLTALDYRFPDYKRVIPDCICTLVDPRYKALLFIDADLMFAISQLKVFGEPMLARQTGIPNTNSNTNTQTEENSESDSEKPSTSISTTNTMSATASTSTSGKDKNNNATATARTVISVKDSISNKSKRKNALWDSFAKLSKQAIARAPAIQVANVLCDELEHFRQEPPIPMENCPLLWWKQHTERYPHLAVVVRGFLSIPATQVKSERLNSTSGNIVTARRGGLLTEHVSELTFLHENINI
jgi:hypothetical protein